MKTLLRLFAFLLALMPRADRQTDIRFMREALAEAAAVLGRTSPNPAVGCVIVKDGQVIGEGWNRRAGEAH